MDREVLGFAIMLGAALLVFSPNLFGFEPHWPITFGLLLAVFGLFVMRQGRLENEEDDRDRR